MKFKQLAKFICQREGKKSQVNIAQVSEILKILKNEVAPSQVAKALGWECVYTINFQIEKRKKK